MVIRDSEKLLPVWMEAGGSDPPCVGGYTFNQLAGLGIPEHCLPVHTCGEQAPAVRAEVSGRNGRTVPGEFEFTLPVQRPDPGCSIR